MINNEKKWIVMNPSDVEWKNAAHLMDRMANYCIGGCYSFWPLAMEA
jgi:hypothetical protein